MGGGDCVDVKIFWFFGISDFWWLFHFGSVWREQ